MATMASLSHQAVHAQHWNVRCGKELIFEFRRGSTAEMLGLSQEITANVCTPCVVKFLILRSCSDLAGSPGRIMRSARLDCS